MAYVAYHKETTVLLTNNKVYASPQAAQGAITRAAKRGEIDREDYMVADRNYFYDNIEKKVERTNIMSGEKYWEGVNTPCFMSPSCESYWSM